MNIVQRNPINLITIIFIFVFFLIGGVIGYLGRPYLQKGPDKNFPNFKDRQINIPNVQVTRLDNRTITIKDPYNTESSFSLTKDFKAIDSSKIKQGLTQTVTLGPGDHGSIILFFKDGAYQANIFYFVPNLSND